MIMVLLEKIKKLFPILSILLWTFSVHAEILYFNDFNDDPTGTYTEANLDADWSYTAIFLDIWQKTSIDNDFIIDGSEAYQGKSLKVRYDSYGGSSGAVWRINLDDDYDELYFSYWVKIESGFDIVEAGFKLPLRPNGGDIIPPGVGYGPEDDGWASRVSIKGTGGEGEEGDVIHYTYHPDMPGVYGENLFWDDGPGGQININSDMGEWHHIETRVKINTPNQYDGIMQSWYDGVLAFEKTDFRFRKSSDFAISRFDFATFLSSSAPDHTEYVYYDNIIISTHKVGPQSPASGIGVGGI